MGFILGAVLLIVGMRFTLGAVVRPMGERVGAQMTKSRKLWLIILVCFFVGIMITISEPDLQVLADQVTVPNAILIGAVSVGVGLFLVVAMLRILFKIPLSFLLIGFYLLVFILARFVSTDFSRLRLIPAVLLRPMTVPFIMALGVGVAAIRSDREAGRDSFGLVALCSIGPILAVLILGMLYHPGESQYVPVEIPDIENSKELWGLFAHGFPEYFKEVALALLPIVIFFALFQVVSLRLKKRQLIKMLVGILYTYIGLVLFLTGVNVGFMPAGNYLGKLIGSLAQNWLLIPIGMVIGYFIVAAEPAVHVLNKQVEEITSGAIPKRAMRLSLSVGVSISVGLSMLRVLTGISIIWFLIPGYLIAILLTFIVPDIFTSIAFDSGGVASGPMTATFLLPLAMGACEAVGGNIAADAFGVVAMVAMTPLITIQILGLTYKIKMKRNPVGKTPETKIPDGEEEIIEL